ncbi:MAG: hypothetical protein ACE5DI_04430 [Candidatus Micrarchaeia archaeon]
MKGVFSTDVAIASLLILLTATMIMHSTTLNATALAQTVKTTSMQRKAIVDADWVMKKCGENPAKTGAAVCKNQKIYSHILNFDHLQKAIVQTPEKACVERLALEKKGDFNEYKIGKLGLEKKVFTVCAN